jgi:oligopeptide/dipeptide ABC transporter ATP-binding protein
VALPPSYLHRYPHELSGGLRQRVGIATALAVGPKLIVADEPVSALDVSVQAQILRLLAEVRQQTGIAVVFISHDLAAVSEVCDSVVVMCLGRIVEAGPTERVYQRPRHPYTQALLSAVLPTDPATPYQPVKLVGDPPSPLEPLSGCVFHTRCRQAEAVCSDVTPDPTDYGSGQRASCHVTARSFASAQAAPLLRKGAHE